MSVKFEVYESNMFAMEQQKTTESYHGGIYFTSTRRSGETLQLKQSLSCGKSKQEVLCCMRQTFLT